MRSLFDALMILVLAARSALAYRPFVSTDAAVAEPGVIELEIGYAGFAHHHDADTFDAPTLTANIGVYPNWEVVAESGAAIGLTARDHRAQAEDTGVFVKWVAREGVVQAKGTGPSLAIEAGALFPTARGEHHVGVEITGIASGGMLGVTYHLNVGGVVDTEKSEPGVTWGIILEHALYGPLRAVAEVNGEAVRGSTADDSVLLGAILDVDIPPFQGFAFDIGVRRGLGDAAPDWSGTAGFTAAFPW